MRQCAFCLLPEAQNLHPEYIPHLFFLLHKSTLESGISDTTLQEATVINADATSHDLLLEEGIGEADAVVALTGMDEENIIMALFAKTQGVKKIIAKVNEDTLALS